MNTNLFNTICQKYGQYASWAIWDDKNENDTQIIQDNINILHSRVIVLSLNISADLTVEWSNFRDGKHDRKLRKAFNHSSYRGAYLTDYFKNAVESKSKKIIKEISKDEQKISRHTQELLNEFNSIGASRDSLIVIMGGKSTYLYSLYIKHIQSSFPRHVYHYHYSYFGLSDEVWLEELWCKFEKNDPTFVRPNYPV